MRIYIDEAGSFVVPRSDPHSFSLVFALVVPSSVESDLFEEFVCLREKWVGPGVELKGSKLYEKQAARIIDLASRYDVLVEFAALDVASHAKNVVNDFRERQADAVTANITREHNPSIVQHLHHLSEAIRRMSNQLFLQAFATIELIFRVMQEATLYYVQRQPRELGDIAWIIDRKDRTITEMEETWTTLILPMGEAHFARKPLRSLEGADYSHFDRRYVFNPDDDPETKRHLEWVLKAYGTPSTQRRHGFLNATRLLSEQRSFLDSSQSVGLQLADMLGTTLRRALNGKLQRSGWGKLGKLRVRHRNIGEGFMQLGNTNAAVRMPKLAATVCKALNARSKLMLVD